MEKQSQKIDTPSQERISDSLTRKQYKDFLISGSLFAKWEIIIAASQACYVD